MNPNDLHVEPADMTPLTDAEFAETRLPESMRDFAFWDDEGWLVTVHCHKAVLDMLIPASSKPPADT